jgi:hypothetical protein
MALGRKRIPKGPDVLFGYLIPLVIIGLTIADFYRDGEIDKYLIGACMIFGLGALGYRIDTLIEKYLDAKSGSPPQKNGDQEEKS